MKKGLKRAFIAGAIFSAALNVNGCVYGPAPVEEPSDVTEETSVAASEKLEDEVVAEVTKL